jgi:hypothetical protein
MRAIGGVDELRRHADAVPSFAHAAFQDVQHSQRLGDFGDVLFLATEGERGGGRAITFRAGILASKFRISSASPSLKYSFAHGQSSGTA